MHRTNPTDPQGARRPNPGSDGHREVPSVWSLGDAARVATAQTIVGERLCDLVEVRARERVLDIATGSGNAAIAAARRRARVVGLDTDASLLARGRERTATERLGVDFVHGRAESLPCADAAFDVAVSVFGVMFANEPRVGAEEILRVVRPDGRIGLAGWTPEGFTGRVFRSIARHAPSLAALDTATRWGTDAGVLEPFGGRASLVALRREEVALTAEAPESYGPFFRSVFGPSVLAFRTLTGDAGRALEDELLGLVRSFNRATDGTSYIRSEYLEAVLRRTWSA